MDYVTNLESVMDCDLLVIYPALRVCVSAAYLLVLKL